MSTIAEDVRQIRGAIYGREVREAIADGIEHCYSDVSSGVTTANTAASTANAAAERANTAAAAAEGIPGTASLTELTKANNSIRESVRTILGDLVVSKNKVINSAESMTSGGYVDNSNGTIVTYSGWYYSDYIPVNENTNYSVIIAESASLSYKLKQAGNIYYAFYGADKVYTHGGITSSSNPNMASTSGDMYVRYSTAKNPIEAFGTAMLVKGSDVSYFTNGSYDLVEPAKKEIAFYPENALLGSELTVKPTKVFAGKYRYLDTINSHSDYCYFDIVFSEPGVYGLYNSSGEITCPYISSEAYDQSGNRYAQEDKKLSGVSIATDFVGIVFHISVLRSDFVKGCYVCLKNKYPVTNPEYIGDNEYAQKGVLTKNNTLEICDVVNPYVDLTKRGYVYVKFNFIDYIFNGDHRRYTFANLKTDLPNRQYDLDEDYMDDVVWADIDPIRHETPNLLVLIPSLNKVAEKASTDADDVILLGFKNNDYKSPYGALWDAFLRHDYFVRESINGGLTRDMLKKINAKENTIYGQIQDGDFVFAYLSDDHRTEHYSQDYTPMFEMRQDYTNMAIGYCDKHIDFDAIVNCGDSILTTDQPLTSMKYCLDLVDSTKLIYTEGNHDRNIEPAHGIVPKKDFFNLMYRRYLKDPSYHFGREYEASYYYKDFEDAKLRFVVLDQYDMTAQHMDVYNDNAGIRQVQFEWLISDALRVASDWNVIVCIHISPVPMRYGNNTINNTLLHQLLVAFKNGTSVTLTATDTTFGDGTYTVNCVADFTNQGARKLVCCLSGHSHFDTMTTSDGVNYVSIACGYMDIAMYHPNGTYWDDGSDRSQRYKSDYSEIAFDVCILRPSARKLFFKRIGYGVDRALSY